jgi:hypothetical protein
MNGLSVSQSINHSDACAHPFSPSPTPQQQENGDNAMDVDHQTAPSPPASGYTLASCSVDGTAR